MNIYRVDAGDQEEAVYEDSSVNAGHYEYYRAIELIAAPSRGAARSEFLKVYPELEITEINSVRIVAHDIDCERGTVDDPRFGLLAHCLIEDYDEVDEWATWQAMYECGDLEGIEDDDATTDD